MKSAVEAGLRSATGAVAAGVAIFPPRWDGNCIVPDEAMKNTWAIKKAFYKGIVRFRRRIGWFFSPSWQRRYRKFHERK